MLPFTQTPLSQCVRPVLSRLTQKKEMDLAWGLWLDSTPFKAHKALPLDSK